MNTHARRVIHGNLYAHLAPPSYGDVMREASDNDLVAEPTQPAPEHVACPWNRKAFLDALCGVNDPVLDLCSEGDPWLVMN